MKTMRHAWSSHFKDNRFVLSFILSFVLLIAALIISFYASVYATTHASSPVTDIILSNIRVFDIDAIFIYGPWIFWIIVAAIVFPKPYQIPFLVNHLWFSIHASKYLRQILS